MRRDRMTFATMIFVPILQLTLFGYAINTDPKQLPTAVLTRDDGPLTRAVLAAHATTPTISTSAGRCATPTSSTGWCARARRSSRVEIPASFERDVRRGDRPAVLVIADATDPVATGTAISAAAGPDRHARSGAICAGPTPRSPRRAGAVRDHLAAPLQPRRHHPIQHRAGPARRGADHDHDDVHRARGDARDRARHHGEPARHADQAGRDHARQDRARSCWSASCR